jgi:hypothetical protein
MKSERIRLRSQSARFAFAECPRCECLRMMALERVGDRSPPAHSAEAEVAL